MHKNRLGDYYTDVLQQELNEIKEPEEIYYHIEFQDETKRDVNPFKLRNFMSDKCNKKVEELTTDSKNRFSFSLTCCLTLKSLKTSPVKLLFTNFWTKLKQLSTYKTANLMENSKDPWKKRTHSSKIQLKRVSSIQSTLKLRQYSSPSTYKKAIYYQYPRTTIRYCGIRVPRPAHDMSQMPQIRTYKNKMQTKRSLPKWRRRRPHKWQNK